MFKTFSFYKFIPVDNILYLQEEIIETMKTLKIFGTILLAPEGVNGSISGDIRQMERFKSFLETKVLGSRDYISNITISDDSPFDKVRVKIKKEIINMQKQYPSIENGAYLDSIEWNKFLENQDNIVIDVRNNYETSIGSFDASYSLNIDKFTDFPTKFDQDFSCLNKDTNIGMFCTGGIRCEKTTALLKEKGFKHVFHLKGGIISYLQNVSETESKWHGDCYVFDKRVAIDQNTDPSSYEHCYACRQPVAPCEKLAKEYKAGISCKKCISDDKINRLKMIERTQFRTKIKQSVDN